MPPVDVEVVEESAPASRSTIGIIYPPPEVRNIVDKTAIFVARNGQEFEARIYQNEIKNPKFNFLNPSDPYHNYYKHKVKEFSEGKVPEPNFAQKSGFGYQLQKPLQEPLLAAKDPPKEPPPEFEFVADPPSISAADLDVVKLTAQFVARNGRQFLVNLMNREQRNYQFDFLRPQHSLYPYFLKLIEQYTKILIPAKALIAKLREETNAPKLLLDQAKMRLQWVEYQEKVKKREEEEKEKERIAYAQVDWHDFVVVETVDYQPSETGNLPPPTTPDEVGARLLAQERYEQGHVDEDAEEMEPEEEPTRREDSDVEPADEEAEEEVEDEEQEPRKPRPAPTPSSGADTRVQDMEEDSDAESDDEDRERRPSSPKDNQPHKTEDPIFAPLPPLPPNPPKEGPPQLPPLPPNPDQVLIRRDYNPKAPKPVEPVAAPDQFLVSPITGEKIPADKIQEHMRIGLLDPKWIEQRDRAIQERREQEEVYAPGSAIGSSLKQLAERRTDIFGSGIEETQIGKKIGEEEKKEKSKVIWDGHTASMEKVAQKARENITIEDQIAVIHKTKGLLPDEEKEKIGPAMPKTSGSMQIPPPQPPKNIQPPLPPARPPPPPQQSMMVPSSSAPPVARPPAPPSQPMRPVAALPPRPPMVGGMMTVGGIPVQPGVVMVPPPPQGPGGATGILGMRPPMPPAIPAPGARPPFMPGPPMVPQMGQPMPPPPPRPPMPPQRVADDDEPPSKKARTEEQLMPENEFLARNKGGPVTFRVQVPNMMDKSEWKLSGQAFTITLPLTDTVSVIKAKMFDELGMPAGKQKLQLDGMFMKDSNSLAFYNFTPMCVVQLQVKERGGRKK